MYTDLDTSCCTTDCHGDCSVLWDNVALESVDIIDYHPHVSLFMSLQAGPHRRHQVLANE